MAEKILIDTGPSERGWHRLETMMLCPQLYAYKYKLGLNAPSLPLVRGTLGHVGLAHYYARLYAIQNDQDPNAYYEPLDAVAVKIKRMHEEEPAAGRIAEGVHDLVRAAIIGYTQQYAGERLQVHAVEQVGRIEFPPYYLTQRFDLVTRDSRGKFWIYDHKFVAHIEQKTVSRYTLSGQFLEMAWQGQHAFGADFGGLRINFVGVGTKLSYVRATPEAAPWALQHFPQTVIDAERLIASCEGRDPWDYPKPFSEQVCVTPYGVCSQIELCRWGPVAAGG